MKVELIVIIEVVEDGGYWVICLEIFGVNG